MAHGPHDSHELVPGATHEAKPLDPENDIDARQATYWFVGSAVVLFLSLWAMVPIFTRVQEENRRDAVELVPNTEFDSTKQAELQYLNGDNPTKKNINTVIAQLRK